MKSIRQLAIEFQEAQRIGDEVEMERLEWELFQAETDAATLREIEKYNEYKLD